MDDNPRAPSGPEDAAVREPRSAEGDAQRLDDLLAGVSHDLKSPLSAIMMAAASLLRISADERASQQLRRKADTIQRCAERMAKVLDDLYDVARLQSGRFAIVSSVQGAAGIVAESVEKSRKAAEERGIALRTEFFEPLPELACDRERVVQVLTWLLADALGAVEAGGAISAGARGTQAAVVFFVEDSGPALTSDDLAHVLERGRPRPGGARHGAPLGLQLARGIVAAHGGRIWVEGGAGGGNRFSFSLPLETAADPTTA